MNSFHQWGEFLALKIILDPSSADQPDIAIKLEIFVIPSFLPRNVMDCLFDLVIKPFEPISTKITSQE